LTFSSGNGATSLFSDLPASALDPVLVSIEQFTADPRPEKVNLGVGMYYDAQGRVPLLRAVQTAADRVASQKTPYGYQPVEGTKPFRAGVERLLFGEQSHLIGDGRLATLQCLGGTGALRVGADLLNLLPTSGMIAVSDPSWVNHPVLFGAAGFEVVHYPYVDSATGGLALDAMIARLGELPRGTIVVLHGCCHNPTGVDIARDQWPAIADMLATRELIPFIDLAYQGFADGIDEDASPVRLLAEAGLPLFVALSFSKSFALYGERVGALCVVTSSEAQTRAIEGMAKNVIRAIYSTPPTHGAALVSQILNDVELGAVWRAELDEMRLRIKTMRQALVERIAAAGAPRDFSFMVEQRGLFSYSGLTAAQIDRLKVEHAIHAVRDGRLCMAALNEGNVDRVAQAIAAVL
jgi:aromatic-amino-acid transaminase